MGIVLDYRSNPKVLWVADGYNNMLRAYDTTTWSQVDSVATPANHRAVGMGMDTVNRILYYGSWSYGAWGPGNGTNNCYSIDLTASTRSVVAHNIGAQVADISVDDDTGLVYLSRVGGASVYDPTTTPWTLVDSVSIINSMAGICVAGISYMPDLKIAKVDDVADGACVGVGGTITYTISYENAGNADLTGVTIVDDLPSEVDYIPATGGGTYDSLNHKVTWNIGNVAKDATGSVTVTVTVNSSATPGSTVINYATIDSNETNPTTVQEDTDICTNQPPVAVCQDVTLNLDADGQATLAAADVDGGSSDPDGDPITLSIDKTDFTCADIGPNTVTLTVSDGQLTDSCQATVTVVDATPPTITLNGDNPQTIECCEDYVELGATAIDNCSGDVTADIVIDASSVDTCTVGTYTVTYNVSDAQGNAAAQVTRTVEVVDTTPPEVWCVESVNPHGNIVPGKNRGNNGKPKGENPDGFYQLFAEDNCSDVEAIEIWVSGFGPFKSGDVVKITEAPGATPSMKKIGSANGQADAVVAHITLNSDPVITAVDGNGNTGPCGDCLVPPPPK